MKILEYNRNAVVNYAKDWAFSRNPKYYDFSSIGGDCTNFASQCLFAGSKIMNKTKNIGWYYNSINDRSPSWTGVTFFYDFLTNNYLQKVGNGIGPFGVETNLSNIKIGDFIQLGKNDGRFYHTLIVVGFDNETPLVASHSFDSYNRNLYSYNFSRLRCISILGVRSLF